MADAVDTNSNIPITDYINAMSLDTEGTLKAIYLKLNAVTDESGIKISQSSLKDLAVAERNIGNRINRGQGPNRSTAGNQQSSNQFQNQGYRRRSNADDSMDFDRSYGRRRSKSMFDKITDDFEDSLVEALTGSKDPIGDAINHAASRFADKLDKSVDQIGNELGRRVGEAFKRSPLGQQVDAELNRFKDRATQFLDKGIDNLADAINGNRSFSFDDLFEGTFDSQRGSEANPEDIVNSSANDLTSAIDAVTGEMTEIDPSLVVDAASNMGASADIATTALETVAGGAGGAGTELMSLAGTSLTAEGAIGAAGAAATALGVSIPVLGVAVVAAIVGIELLTETLGRAADEIGKGFSAFSSGVSGALNRDLTARTKYNELAKKRMEEDIKSVRKAAFDVIEESAKKVQDVWDNILATVSATQGYDKAGVQDLWSSYAERLKEEGLDKVISSADIMSQLESVLKQGLSGLAAEEFAYQATILNNAVPTEDFFQYASTYASIVANAMKDGADQEHAIALANEELATFADNLLHASRQLAGGLTTSLQNSADLFAKSAEIAFTSRTGDISEISRLLTSVSGVVGAIAPDLASGIVDAVYQAATGGNSSEITALRSLSGAGAGNTAFLRALAQNPQLLFSTLFHNLSELQNMSSANYMEVAEALSGVFGISKEAFARVDFDYLASAIDQMNETNGDLQTNLDLLSAGQTTLTASQVRMQKINEYMIDEGLAYVLDNEVAREIQQHMWDEQLAREIEETQFSVDLVGGALALLTGILNAVDLIGSFLNPVGWVSKVANLALTAIEGVGESNDINEILKRGVVGEGNQEMFKNLTTRGEDLGLATPYVELLGGISEQRVVDNLIKLANTIATPIISGSEIRSLAKDAANDISRVGETVLDIVSSGSEAVAEAAESISNNAEKTIDEIVNGTSAVVDEVEDIGKTIGEQAEDIKPVEVPQPVDSYYKRAIVSKSVASLISSGDWRTNRGFNAIWGNYGDSGTDWYETPTQEDAKELSELISTSLKDYVKNAKDTSRSLDDLRKTIASDNEDKLIERDIALLESQGTLQHRGFFSNADMVSAVAAKLEEIEGSDQQSSFDDWLKDFEEANGIGNLSALLSDYGESIETIQALYQQEQAARENAAEKARALHEVQFWEDMQQFATVDFPWLMREWERYYIQHEAYTKATSDAYQEAIDLSVKEKGEMGDSVLALAEALTENNIWAAEELGHAIKDPTVQTNVILSKILLVVEAIMQQNNESSIVSVPTALSALGLSISNV